MTIYFLSGTPGSGKSLEQAKLIRAALRRGRPVVCNYDINTNNIKRCKGTFLEIPNDELTAQKLTDFADDYWAKKGGRVKEDYITLCLDECQLLFNARTWNEKGRKDWIKFFSQHRKYGYKCLLVSQYDRSIDRQLRALFEYELKHRALQNCGMAGFAFALLFGGKVFCSIKSWYGVRGQAGIQGRTWILPLKRYTSLYNTHNLFDDSLSKVEQ